MDFGTKCRLDSLKALERRMARCLDPQELQFYGFDPDDAAVLKVQNEGAVGRMAIRQELRRLNEEGGDLVAQWR